MKDYAIFISLTDNYVYLFNALYNSVELFGIGEYADFVVLYDFLPESYLSFMKEKTKDLKTQVRFIQIEPEDRHKDMNKVIKVKFYRYKYMAEIGKEYKSILFLDSDIFFASGIKEYFEISRNTDIIVATNDNVVRNYKNNIDLGTCPAYLDKTPVFNTNIFDGKFICNVPTFIDMNKYDYVFNDIFEHVFKMGMDTTWPFSGDLETMNIVMIKNNVKDKIMIIPSHLWTGVHFSYFKPGTAMKRWRPSNDTVVIDNNYKKNFLFMSETCEHIRSFHGRDWTTDKSEEAFKERYIPKMILQSEGEFKGAVYEQAKKRRELIFDTIQAYFIYLSFESYISLEDVSIHCDSQKSRIDYLKKKKQLLSNIINTFKD